MAIDIKAFFEKFTKEYDFLYKSKNHVAGYTEAVNAFDELLKTDNSFIGEFAKYRGDFITSDREAAAFMFTLSEFITA